MKFTVECSLLMQFLRAASKVVSQKNNNSVPILSNILFNLKGNQLHLTVADTSCRLSTIIEVVNAGEDGTFTIQESIITSTIRELPDQPITIEVNPENYQILLTYSNGHYKFMGEGSEAYPVSVEVDKNAKKCVVSAEALLKGLRSCKFAASTDDKRPIMTGVCLDILKDRMVFAATDGRILLKYTNENVKSELEERLCLSSPSCTIMTEYVLPKEKGDVVISFDQNYILIELSNTTLIARMLDGKYPNYDSVIPQTNPFEITVNKAELQSAAKRVSIFSNKVSSLVVFDIKHDSIKISANDLEFSAAAEETIKCSTNSNQTDLRIGFDFNTLSRILDNTSSEDIKFLLADQTRGGLILPATTDEGISSCALIMPIRLVGE